MNENLINRVTISKVFSDFTSTTISEGTVDTSAQCPFHNDTSGDSLRVYHNTNSAYCFGGCGSFRPVNVLMQQLGIPYKEAQAKLEAHYHLRPLTPEEEDKLHRQTLLTPYVYAIHQELTEEHRNLLRSRGLTDYQIDAKKIGYHPNELDESFDQALEQLGIYYKDADGDYVSDFVEKIIIPLYRNNEIVSVCAWNPNGEPKYMYPRGMAKPLCGAVTEGAILVEGVFDLLSLEQEGFKAMTTLGAAATKTQMEELEKLKKFTIAFDGDSAGQKGAYEIAAVVYPKASIIQLDSNEDPNALHTQLETEFASYFETLQIGQADLLDIVMDGIKQISSKREAAVAFNDQCIPLLAQLSDVEFDATLADISGILKNIGVTKGSIQKALKKQKKAAGTSGTKQGIALLYDELAPKIPLYLDQTKETYAHVTYENMKKLVKVTSTDFKHYIRREARNFSDGAIIGADALNQVVNQFDADAHQSGKPVALANRIAWNGNDIVYDMTDEQGTVIRINEHGWRLDESNQALFKREVHQLPQVIPVKGGSITEFLKLFSLTEDQKILIAVWLVYMLVPDVPKPILYVQAEKGSGKSDFTRSLRSIVDPSTLPSLKEPNNEDRLVNQLYHNYLPLFDNINYMPRWFIRLCCTTATGESDERRKLFTDDDAFILTFTRPIIINAINRLAIDYPDFQDRTVLMKLNRIPEERRVEHSVFVDKVETLKPQVLGEMLDALSKAMALKPSISLGKLPRMADFATWGCAIAEPLGYTQEQFLQAYYNNMELANEEMIFDHVVAHAIYEFMVDKPCWNGRPSDFLEELKEAAIEANIDVKDRHFPKSPSALTKRLNEIKSNLEDVGIVIELPRQSGGKRIMGITNTKFNTNNTAQQNLIVSGEI